MRVGFWRRHSWKALLFLTTVIGLFGVSDIVFGADAERLPVTGLTMEQIRATSEPVATYIDALEQVGGVHLIVMSLFGGAILLVPFRRGDDGLGTPCGRSPCGVWQRRSTGCSLTVSQVPHHRPSHLRLGVLRPLCGPYVGVQRSLHLSEDVSSRTSYQRGT